MRHITKTRVSGSAIALTVGAVIVVATSIITLLVLPKFRAMSPADSDPECKSYWEQKTGTSKSGTTFQFWAPLDGYCAHGGAIVYNTEIKSCDACKSYGPDGFIAWNLKTGTTTDARAPGLEAVNGYVAGAALARDRIIRTLNNGEKTEQELVDMFALMRAGYVNLACGVGVTSDYTGSSFTKKLVYKKTDPPTPAVDVQFMSMDSIKDNNGRPLTGTVDLVRKFSIMWSRMMSRPDGNPYGLCQRLPEGCTFSSSYRENDYNPCKSTGQTVLSPHGMGMAIDISCAIPSSASGCTGVAADLLEKIKKYNEGFNITTECSVTERKTCGDGSTSVQVIHLDLGGQCTRDQSDNGEACLYVGCNYSDCTSPKPRT